MAESAAEQVAGLLGPIDAREQPAAFGLMNRVGQIVSYRQAFNREALSTAEQAGYDVEVLRTEAQPFMIGEEFDGALIALEDPSMPQRSIHACLARISARRIPSVNEIGGLETWVTDLEPHSEVLWDAWAATDRRVGGGIITPDTAFDATRLCLLLAAGMLKDRTQSVFSFVAGAGNAAGSITDTKERALAFLMLEKAMAYAHGVNLYNSMQMFQGRGGEVPLQLPVHE